MSYTFTPPIEVVESKTEPLRDTFYQRLIKFYQDHPKPNLSNIWTGVLQIWQTEVVAALEASDPAALRLALENAYVTSTMMGMDSARNDAEFVSRFQNSVVALGNILGVVPVYNPEQDHPVVVNIEEVLSSAERMIDATLTHPGGGRMRGAKVGDRFVPWKLLDVLVVALSCPDVLDVYGSILEIGSGSGFFGYLATLINGELALDYDVIDIPTTSVIGAYVSACAYGTDAVWLLGERQNDGCLVRYLGTATGLLRQTGYQIAFNQDSIPEMPSEVSEVYIQAIAKFLKPGGFFISNNHESERIEQHRVYLMVKSHPTLKQIRRDLYFGRPGYLTEVWKKC